jgi:ribose 5-phosphate isomerase RpiB
MRIVLGADRAGFDLKESLRRDLIGQGQEVLDLGSSSHEARHERRLAKIQALEGSPPRPPGGWNHG